MKKLTLAFFISLLFFSCGEPEAYDMTQKEFQEAYREDVAKIVKEQMRKALKEGLAGERDKDDIKNDGREELTEKIEDLTGLTFEELELVNKNWEEIKALKPEGYKEMKVKEILNYNNKEK